MTGHGDFEDRLRHTFDAEAQALAERNGGLVDASHSSAASFEGPAASRSEGRSRALIPLLAAALLLVAGIAGVFALAREDSPAVPVTSTGVRPLITATPTPTTVPTETAEAGEPSEGEPSEGEPSEKAEQLVHVVEAGDALTLIAQRYNVSLESILEANPDLDPAVLRVGDEVLLPPGASMDARLELPSATPSEPTPTPIVPTPTPTPGITAVPEPQPTPRPTPEGGLPVAASFCVTRDAGWLAEGTCGIVVIGEPASGQVAVQRTDGLGQVTAGFIAIDALAPSGDVEVAVYQSGLLEDSWCVVDIFAPDTLNVRQGPSTDREIVGELPEGQCRIFRTAVGDPPFPGWTPVSVDFADGTALAGWVASAYLRRDIERVPSGIPMQTISVRVELIGGGPGTDVNVPSVEAFEFVDGATTLGSPDTAGILTIPAANNPIGLIAQAPVEGDRFCAWTGSLEATDGAGYHVLRVAMLCA